MEMQDVEEFDIEEQSDDKDEDGKKLRPMIRSAVDLQRLKLEKLMKNPDKPVIIPELPRERDFLHTVPSFVRNVMGSSAGAGSGEFHVYRHLRRKEYARQKYIQSKSIREQLDDEFQAKLEQNKLTAEAKTAKKRAKRQKRKAKMKQRGKKPKTDKEDTSDYNDQDSSNESSNDEKKEDQTENVQDGEVKEEEKSKSEQEEEKLDEKSTESTTEENVDENRTESTAEENLDEKSTEPMPDENLDEKTAEAPVEEKRQECERRPEKSSVTVENELSLCQEDVPPLKDCDTEEKKSAKCIELNS